MCSLSLPLGVGKRRAALSAAILSATISVGMGKRSLAARRAIVSASFLALATGNTFGILFFLGLPTLSISVAVGRSTGTMGGNGGPGGLRPGRGAGLLASASRAKKA